MIGNRVTLLHYGRSSARRISANVRFHCGLVRSLLQFFLLLLLSLGVFVDLLVSLQCWSVCKSRSAFFTRILFLAIRLAHIFSSNRNPQNCLITVSSVMM